MCMAQPILAAEPEKTGVTRTPPLKPILAGTADEEIIVWNTEYAPGGINPRHFHPAAITFRVLSGTGVWQEEEKPPVTLHPGDSLFVPAGTTHSHWNPNTTEPLLFLEFIVAERTKGARFPGQRRINRYRTLRYAPRAS